MHNMYLMVPCDVYGVPRHCAGSRKQVYKPVPPWWLVNWFPAPMSGSSRALILLRSHKASEINSSYDVRIGECS